MIEFIAGAFIGATLSILIMGWLLSQSNLKAWERHLDQDDADLRGKWRRDPEDFYDQDLVEHPAGNVWIQRKPR